jgi:hypothetical protein
VTFDNEHLDSLAFRCALKYENNSYDLGVDQNHPTIEGNPIPVPAGSNAWVCHRTLAGIVGCCQVEVSVMCRSLVRGVPSNVECMSVIRCNNHPPRRTMIRHKAIRLRKNETKNT